jgi:predicted membrane protein
VRFSLGEGHSFTGEKMNFLPFIFRFALAGAVVPVLLNILWWVINNTSSHNLSFEIVMEKITLLLWPSSIALLAGAGFSNYAMSIKLLLLAVIINVILYSVLGLSVWYGFAKNHILLLLPIAAVGALWSWLLML